MHKYIHVSKNIKTPRHLPSNLICLMLSASLGRRCLTIVVLVPSALRHDKNVTKETYTYEKRPPYMKRDLNI